MSRKNEITKFQFIELRKLELMEGYIMIGFSIMMWFCSALLIFVSFSLLKGNYSSVHGKVFETTNDRKGYAKALGKTVIFTCKDSDFANIHFDIKQVQTISWHDESDLSEKLAEQICGLNLGKR